MTCKGIHARFQGYRRQTAKKPDYHVEQWCKGCECTFDIGLYVKCPCCRFNLRSNPLHRDVKSRVPLEIRGRPMPTVTPL
ncbi:hypothetical protein NTE_03394 [Candidatus Nitrososphaera evergladensis SR1]|uniref:Uncharacterized protein n=1 Tax=Candidatus Nitrososphaera evergladensis SR1 TaxID=1459636 RepID=A0A075MXT4_9ARCH|nr:hypothetical protein [Candidatus Nitrososphaera evergladensis]AIF85422.1 hypothetical protein NTE_03394 [Candidatus Nitrososphaera evergladensis SR1]